jgi:cellobiose-specific phosphotransferase system component IIC
VKTAISRLNLVDQKLANARLQIMSIINSSTTGHSKVKERKFSNRLFIGLIALVLAAIVIALIAGQKKELNPTASENKNADSTSSAPVAPQDQPKN